MGRPTGGLTGEEGVEEMKPDAPVVAQPGFMEFFPAPDEVPDPQGAEVRLR